jgi:hypothetical protein
MTATVCGEEEPGRGGADDGKQAGSATGGAVVEARLKVTGPAGVVTCVLVGRTAQSCISSITLSVIRLIVSFDTEASAGSSPARGADRAAVSGA